MSQHSHAFTRWHNKQPGSLQCWFFRLLKSTQCKWMIIVKIFVALDSAIQFLLLVRTSSHTCLYCSFFKSNADVNQGAKRRKKRFLLWHSRSNRTETMHDFWVLISTMLHWHINVLSLIHRDKNENFLKTPATPLLSCSSNHKKSGKGNFELCSLV